MSPPSPRTFPFWRRLPLAVITVAAFTLGATGYYSRRGVRVEPTPEIDRVSPVLSGVEHPVPGSFDEELPVGDFVLLLEVPILDDIGAVPFGSSPFLALEEIVVTGPDGATVITRPSGEQTAIGGSYQSEVAFRADRSGVYSFTVVTSEPTRALLAAAEP